MPQLLPDERDKLYEALRRAFPKRSDMLMFLGLSLGANLDDIASEATYAEAVFNVILWSESEDRTEELVKKACAKKPNNKLLNDVGQWLLAELQKRSDREVRFPKDPFETYLLKAGQPFVNRRTLRAHLRELTWPDGSRILAVSGPPGTGKSYSINFIAHVAQRMKSFKLLLIDVEEKTRATFNPDQFVRSLINQMGRRSSIGLIPKQGETQDARWLIELRDWIVAEINQTTQTWWLVCDGVCHTDVPSDTRELLTHLIKIAHLNVPQLRVIVLACTPAALPTDILPFIRQENTDIIGQPEVKEYFEQLVGAKIIKADSGAVEEAVRIVFAASNNGTGGTGGAAPLAALLAEATHRLRTPPQ
jgi:hypothetical protein